MSEIRDRIEYTIGSMAQDFKDGYCTREGLVKAILSRQELAIVDREAELPQNRMTCNMKVIGEPGITKQVQDEIRREMRIWEECQQDMLEAGWVKEVKD